VKKIGEERAERSTAIGWTGQSAGGSSRYVGTALLNKSSRKGRGEGKGQMSSSVKGHLITILEGGKKNTYTWEILPWKGRLG